jgi:D-arabinose 1-dehydrogenase-like Zn-dependent alcohol dehydrogenase
LHTRRSNNHTLIAQETPADEMLTRRWVYANYQIVAVTTYGGYSDKIVVSEKFVLSIPDGLDPAGAAPLLCAGITTWEPLKKWNVGQDSKVAVVGLGGLGHMALKLAKALGADVTLFTRFAGKEEDARRLCKPLSLLAIAGSFIGGVAATQEMQNFCGEHGVVSEVEVIPIQMINEAYERMLKSDVKYRFVIDMSSLTASTA